jgi:hypothetical protein
MAANLDTISSAVLAVVQGLTLAGISSANISRKMLPHIGEVIDNLPAILIAAGEAETQTPLSFEGQSDLVYPVEVSIVAAVNRDYVTNLPAFFQWRQQIRQAFLPGPLLSGAPTVWMVRLRPQAVFDRSDLDKNYGYISVSFDFHSAE